MSVVEYRGYSVLMSVYYKEKPEYLKQAIESIQTQTFPTDDFVLVCDGPLNDGLDAIIAEKQQEMGDTLNVVRLAKNGGLGNALNVGIKYCKNELIARMDSDDISCPERCEKQLKLFQANPGISLCSGTIEEFATDENAPIGVRNLPESEIQILKFSKKRNPFNHVAVMFKKSEVIAAGGYSEDYHLFEDYYLWIRMLKNGCKAVNLPDVLVKVRCEEDMYARRGGVSYAKDMLRFHWWIHKIGWTSIVDFCTGALPHACVCVMPNSMRRAVYILLRK